MDKPILTQEQMRHCVIEIEKNCSDYVKNEVEALRARGGEALSVELYGSIAALFLARAVAVMHVRTGESAEAIRSRCLEAFEANLKTAMRTIAENARIG